MPLLGETAALLTAACWACTSILFGFAVLHLGSFRLNVIRLTFAALALAILSVAIFGTAWLIRARSSDLWFLALSGCIGLTFGDWAYFQGLRMLGPRMGTLFMTLSPPMTAALGAMFLHENPAGSVLAGMALTLAGVVWVVLERPADGAPRGHRVLGSFLATLGSLGQAIGYVLSKLGMSGGIDPLPASAVRLVAATLAVYVIALVARQPFGFAMLRGQRRVFGATLGASLLGPVLGIWLSLVAVKYTQAGIAATLIASVPVLVLPLVVWVQKEKVSPRAALGAIVAVTGVALLFIKP